MRRPKNGLFGDESGVVRDCLIACGIGLMLFLAAAATLWLSGYL